MSQPPGLPPEGWYPNPENPEQQRWWDGQAWTEHVAVGAPMAPGYEQQQPPAQRAQQPGQQPGQQEPRAPMPASYPAQPQQPYQPPHQPYQQQPYGGGYQSQHAQPAQPGVYQPYQPYPSYQQGGGYPAYPAALPRGVLPDGARVAGWWMRVLARFLDGLVTTVPLLLLGLPLIHDIVDKIRDYVDAADAADRAGLPIPHFNTGSITRDFVLLGLIGGAVQIIYEVVLLKLCGATVGKLACGLRVRAWDVRGPLTWAAVLKRVVSFQVATSVPQVGSLYYLIDVLWPLWDSRKQALHDKVAGTAVVKKYDAELAPQMYGGATGFGSYRPY